MASIHPMIFPLFFRAKAKIHELLAAFSNQASLFSIYILSSSFCLPHQTTASAPTYTDRFKQVLHFVPVNWRSNCTARSARKIRKKVARLSYLPYFQPSHRKTRGKGRLLRLYLCPKPEGTIVYYDFFLCLPDEI